MTQTGTPTIEPSETSETVQLLVADAGNRSAISGMLDEHFDVETSQTVTDADLYLIEDHLFPEYRSELRERIEREHPAFCPVVLIRRETTNLKQGGVDPSAPEEGVRYDEVVDAPIDPRQLIQRLNSLLVRRQQSRELMQQVSTLEQQEQRLRRFEQGVKSTGNGIVMTDPSGTIEYANPALESIAGYTEDDVLGKSPQILLPEGTGEVFDDEFWRTMADQAEWEGDIIIEGKDAHRLVVNATATALHDVENGPQGFVIVLSDITERIQREQALEDREVELELLRQILTRYLRHNLRNNLNVIQGSAELLKEDETLSPQQIELAETIISNSEDLMEMSDTARTYSSLIDREAMLSPFDLVEITTNAVQSVRESFPDVDFEIDAPETCDIRAREGIQRAIEELIDNAARHNDVADPWVRIQVRDREGARLVIEDNGPGISEQERASLERGTETQLSHSQGFGLWLSKSVIEGVDGRLSINLTDQGTRVIADFPPIAAVGSTGLEVITLKEREQRLQTITDRMTDAIIGVDADWNVTLLDGPAEEMLNIDADAVVGHSLWDVFSDLRDTHFETVVRTAMESRSSTSVEQYLGRIDTWLEANVYPEFDGGLSFYTRDISERKEREQEFQQESARFKAVFENSFDAMVLADDDGRYIEVNESATEMFGLSEDELLGRSIAEFAPADYDFGEAWEQFQASDDERGTFPLVRADGVERVVEFAATRDIVPGQHLSILRDITERIKEERKREQIIDRVTDAIVEVGSDWRFTLVNEQAEDLYGMDEESLLGRDFWSVFDDAKGTTFEEEYREVMESRESTSFVEYFSQLDGWFDIKAYPKDDGGIAFYFVEVTERYERERELSEKTRQLEAIVQNTEEAIYIKDTAGYYQFINESGADVFDMSAEEVIGKHDEDLFDSESAADIRREDEKVMESGQAVRKETMRYIAGEKHVFLDAKYPHRDEDGEVIGLIGISPDITEQTERQNRMKQDAARLDALFEQSPDMINVHDLEGNIIDPNPSLCEETGYDEAELTDMKVWQLDQAIEPDEALALWEGMELGDRERLEGHYQHRDGSKIPVEIHIRRLNLAGEPRFMVISRNIAERKEYERAIEAQNERLEEFTSVVSHDLRNPLNAAEGWLEIVQEECDSEHLERIERALDRMDALIEDLRTLAREGETISDFESVELAALVEGCWVNVETADAKLVTDSDRAIYADKSRLKQVFENLVHNAVEHGGDDVTVTIGVLDDGFYFEDDGPGIPEETNDAVFDVGYSMSDEGTGFGLSIVKQIAEAHDWNIRVTESKYGGARFEITGVEFTSV